jgi:hypothetical protein
VALLFPHDPGTAESVRALSALINQAPTLGYVGPDQLMPLTSIIGAIVGLALMFWHRLVGLTRKGWNAVRGRKQTPAPPSNPPAN